MGKSVMRRAAAGAAAARVIIAGAQLSRRLRTGPRIAVSRFSPRRVGSSFARLGVPGLVISVLALLLGAPANASSVTGASFSGGAGTVSVDGTLYARSGGAL